MSGRRRKLISVRVRPDLYERARERKLNLGQLLDQAIERALEPPVEKAIGPIGPIPEMRSVSIDTGEEWHPRNVELARRVRERLCSQCEESPSCDEPCERFKTQYEKVRR